MKNILALLLLCYGMNMDAQKQYITDVITPGSPGFSNDTGYRLVDNVKAEDGSYALYSGYLSTSGSSSDSYISMKGEISSNTIKSQYRYPNLSVSKSGGKVRKIKIKWANANREIYRIDVYGSNVNPCVVSVNKPSVKITNGVKLGTISASGLYSIDSLVVNEDYSFASFVPVMVSSPVPSFLSIEIDWDYTYTRPTTPDKFGTICLPYNVPSTNYEGAEFYSIAGVNKDVSDNITAVVLQEETDLIAGTPYIFKATGSTLSATYTNGKSDVQSATGLVGWMPADETSTTAVPTDSYILSNNEIHQITGNATATIGPNRAYLNLAAVPTYVPNPGEAKGRIIRLGLDGSITDLNPAGIEEITNDDNTSISAIYSLDGTKLANMHKGMNIVRMKNGITKKVHIK